MRLRGVASGALALAALAFGGGGVAQAQTGPQLENGKTKAVYDYKAAIRERVFIPQPGIDQDRNGQMDWVTADIIRPSESSATNKIPAIIDPSPYYTTVCRGNESQCMADWNDDGVNDRWPLFLDNYFVPRGYAYVLGQMNGTGYTENGCPMHGGPGDIAGEKSIVDWLNGRVKAYKAASLTAPEVVADWHNGSSAMIGKSYDGTLSNGVAATGVEGLKTIVPVSAISSWYLYSRTGGIRNNTNYPNSLNNNITTAGGTSNPPGVNLPGRRTLCAPINADISNDANVDTGDGDAHGDINTFWNDRDYVKDASKVKAAVFATHGFQDDNVRMDHEWNWQQALKANGVHTKLWLLRAGHTDPFESRRAVWVDTLHRWFDHYLYGVDNGVEKEPAVTIEDEKDVWHDYASWPIPGTQNVDVFLRGSADANAAGTLGGMSGGAQDALTFTGTAGYPSETTVISTPEGSQANRRVFLSGKLKKDVRISGQTSLDLVASVPGTQENYGAVIVDYGAGTQVTRSGEGIRNLSNRTCWGETSNNAVTGAPGPSCTIGAPCEASPREVDTACYLEVEKPTQDVTQWRVTRGTLDSSNRNSLFYTDATPLTPNEKVHLRFPTFATEHTFKAGHQIGVVIVGNLFGGGASGSAPTSASPAQPITIDTKQSKVILPVLGGYKALAEAGGTDAETVPPVIGAVSADITTHTADPTGVVVNYPTPTVTDNEDPNPSISCSPPSGSKFKAGSTVVTCTATDANGNTATKSFTVNVGFDGTVGGTVPPTLALTIGNATFGAFTPGIAKDYTASANATVVSTAGDAALSVSTPGHLMNGTFSLASPLQVALSKSAWTAPVSNDNVKVDFTQHIDANEALRTGTYSTTLTFTLSTTNP